MTDEQFRKRAEIILWHMSLENTGWRRWLRRWLISSEPLRNDAGYLLSEAGYRKIAPGARQLHAEETRHD